MLRKESKTIFLLIVLSASLCLSSCKEEDPEPTCDEGQIIVEKLEDFKAFLESGEITCKELDEEWSAIKEAHSRLCAEPKVKIHETWTELEGAIALLFFVHQCN